MSPERRGAGVPAINDPVSELDTWRPSADRCVIVATLGNGYPFVVAPISFDGP